jgi:tetratricopeptide (TPR) repeat protein
MSRESPGTEHGSMKGRARAKGIPSAIAALWVAMAVAFPASGEGDDENDAQGEGQQDEVDHLDLAALLIQDGHHDRAELVLAEVDLEDEDLDMARYTLLAGLVALKLGHSADAVDLLEKSVQAGQEDPVVFVFLAQARFALQDFSGTLEALDAAGETAEKLEGSYLIRAQCHWRMDDRVGAWLALEAGLARYPGLIELMRHRVMLLMEMELYLEALDDGEELLAHEQAGADDYVAIAEALRRGQQLQRAIIVLEVARLRYPDNEPILRQLAQTYLDHGWPLTAARLLHEASGANPALKADVAELYRRAGKLLLALHVNAQVQDQSVKVRQRLGILIEMGRFEEAVALEPRLSRLGLFAEEAIRYAFAYALYRVGDLSEAEPYLKGISDPLYYDKSIALVKAIDTCRTNEWACE